MSTVYGAEENEVEGVATRQARWRSNGAPAWGGPRGGLVCTLLAVGATDQRGRGELTCRSAIRATEPMNRQIG